MPDARRQARRQRRRLRAWSLIGGVYLVVLIAGGAAVSGFWTGPGIDLHGQLARVRAKIKADRHRLARLRPQLAAASITLAANHRLAHQPDWSLLLGLMSDRLGQKVVLASCQLTPRRAPAGRPHQSGAAQKSAPEHGANGTGGTGYVLLLTGFGRSHAAVLGYVRRLEHTTLFSEVKLLDADQKPFQTGEAISFHIRCALPRIMKGT